MSGKKGGLHTVQECGDMEMTHPSPAADKEPEPVPCSSRATLSQQRRATAGSRLSLTSLLSLSSGGGRDRDRERSRSVWSSSGECWMMREQQRDESHTGRDSRDRSACSAAEMARGGGSAGDISGGGRAVREKRYRLSDCGEGGRAGGDDAADELLLLTGEEQDMSECSSSLCSHSAARECGGGGGGGGKTRECPLCLSRLPLSRFAKLIGCTQHTSCVPCLQQYVEVEIMESRVEISCPECCAYLHPEDVRQLVGAREALMHKYRQFSIRKYLMTDPDTRWCPAPDCTYAVIASGCAACPQLQCAREECGTLFCYHCKGTWHAAQTCDEARRTRLPRLSAGAVGRSLINTHRMVSGAEPSGVVIKPGDVKACPRCRTLIVKMDDGSCNHMVCAMCSAEFCWLCLKEISDLHYLSPTGCTFWGKKPWTRKRKLLWQLGTLVGAPVGIALVAGLSVPGIIFGVPVFVGRKVHQRFLHSRKLKRRAVTAACVAGSLVVSPVLAVMAVGVGVPIMLAYVYGVVPLSLCRNGGCGLSDGDDVEGGEVMDQDTLFGGAGDNAERVQLLVDERPDGVSIAPGASIASGSSAPVFKLMPAYARRHSVENSQREEREERGGGHNYEEASVRAMAGSQHGQDDKSVHTMWSGHEQQGGDYCDEIASTKALAGSVHDSKSLCGSVGARRGHAASVGRSDYVVDELDESHESSGSTVKAGGGGEREEGAGSPQPGTSREGDRLARFSRQKTLVLSDEELHMRSQEDDSVGDVSRSSRGTLKRGERVERPRGGGAELTGAGPSGMNMSVLDSSSRSSYQFHSPSSRDQASPDYDPFKIRTLMDNMKQMVAVDEQPSGQMHKSSESRSLDRSRSGRSFEEQNSQQNKKRRGFFGLFRK